MRFHFDPFCQQRYYLQAILFYFAKLGKFCVLSRKLDFKKF
ncbi:hypothetical protein TDIS_1858 [Thermosulfurimonas dismutans]|uniref:Uncharacterized protein n=1 Tax=Thermosulfurimonas dismutans TaxID=999894 RepID=A0A179D2V1_9BACT|nr:hypothetical protein TDIS_1858 [Thermosulfurimonas dismutans]